MKESPTDFIRWEKAACTVEAKDEQIERVNMTAKSPGGVES
jgi:hypothetical protein